MLVPAARGRALSVWFTAVSSLRRTVPGALWLWKDLFSEQKGWGGTHLGETTTSSCHK